MLSRGGSSKRMNHRTANLHADCWHIQRDWVYLQESLPQMDSTCQRKKTFVKKLCARFAAEPCHALEMRLDFAEEELEEHRERRQAVLLELARLENAYDEKVSGLHRLEVVKLRADVTLQTQQLKYAESESMTVQEKSKSWRTMIARLKGQLLESDLKNLDLNHEVAKLREHRDEQDALLIEAQEKAAASTRSRDDWKAHFQSVAKKLKRSEQEAAALRRHIDLLAKEGHQVDLEITTLEEKVESAAQVSNDARSVQIATELELAEAKREIARLSARLSRTHA